MQFIQDFEQTRAITKVYSPNKKDGKEIFHKPGFGKIQCMKSLIFQR